MPEEVSMDTEKATSNINGEVDSNVGDRCLKHELQMQQMVENMIKEREEAKEGLRDDKNVGSGEGKGGLSSLAEEETVGALPGCDGGHTQEDEGSLADTESTSDTLAGEDHSPLHAW